MRGKTVNKRSKHTMADTNLQKLIKVVLSFILLSYHFVIGNSQTTLPILRTSETTSTSFNNSLNHKSSTNDASDSPPTPPIDEDNHSFIQPPATDKPFYYDYFNIGGKLNPEDVQMHLNHPDTVEYIESFTNEFQKHLIRETLRYCPYIQLCNFSLGLEAPMMGIGDEEPCCEFCSCYSDCIKTGSCCPDYPGIQLQHVTNSPVTGETESCMLNEIKKQWANDTSENYYVLAVQSCPPDTAPSLSHRCSGELQTFSNISFEDVIPLYSDMRNKTYRNKHCAVCNGADIDALSAWDLHLNCPTPPVFSNANDILSAIINGMSHCIIQLRPPLSANVEYCSHLIETCNITGIWTDFDQGMVRACKLYEAAMTVRYGDTSYQFKNPFCAICNGMMPTEYLCSREINTPASPFAFSGLLSFSSRDSGDEDVSTVCDKDYIYDDITKRCMKITCSPYRIFKADQCEVFLETSDNAAYRFTSRLLPSDAIDLERSYDLMPEILSVVEDIIQSYNVGYICAKQTLIVVRNISTSNGGLLMVESVDLQYDISSHNEHNVADFVDHLLSTDGLEIKLNDSRFDTITFTLLLKGEDMYIPIPYDFYSNWSVPTNTPVDLKELLWFSFTNEVKSFVPFFNWNHMSGPCRSQTEFHPLLTLQACPMININISEYSPTETQNGIRFGQEKDIVLRLSDYFSHNSTHEFKLCLETYKKVFRELRNSAIPASFSADLIVSITCVSISITCLLISVITYCALPQLQTLPGKNNMALIITLLTAQGIYLVGSYAGFESGTIECQLIGGLTHFFWLLAIFWMNACTLHMFRVLLQTRDMAHSNSSRKHLQYHLYCIISSIVFVLVNILVSMINSNYTDIGYGKYSCYISEQRMVEFTFGIPTGVVIIANMSMFIAIIIKLKRAPTVSKNVKHERNYFFVFAKLSTITGATWLFGFVFMWSGVVALSYVFIILNGGQGLFLMLAFVCNKRTLDMIRNRKEILTTSIFGRTESSKVSSKSID